MDIRGVVLPGSGRFCASETAGIRKCPDGKQNIWIEKDTRKVSAFSGRQVSSFFAAGILYAVKKKADQKIFIGLYAKRQPKAENTEKTFEKDIRERRI